MRITRTPACVAFLFGSLHQFFWDGNKRTARLMMNGILLSEGYDAISIPAASPPRVQQTHGGVLRHERGHGDDVLPRRVLFRSNTAARIDRAAVAERRTNFRPLGWDARRRSGTVREKSPMGLRQPASFNEAPAKKRGDCGVSDVPVLVYGEVSMRPRQNAGGFRQVDGRRPPEARLQ